MGCHNRVEGPGPVQSGRNVEVHAAGVVAFDAEGGGGAEAHKFAFDGGGCADLWAILLCRRIVESPCRCWLGGLCGISDLILSPRRVPTRSMPSDQNSGYDAVG